MGQLAGQVCLVVGGTSGIGLAAAERFAREGARVLAAGLMDAGFEGGRSELRGGAIEWVAYDVRGGMTEAEALVARAIEHGGGRLDVLFHVAGMSGRRLGDGSLVDCSEDAWDGVMAVNAKGVFATNRAAVRQMMRQAPDRFEMRGSIVNVGSVLDRSPAARHFGTFAYAASKGAVRAMTLAGAASYGPSRIRFNLIEPGLIDTPMAARAVGDDRLRPYLAAKQPLGPGPGEVSDVVEAALYLCSPAARFVTGAVLAVDGGWCVSEGTGVE
jgi:NAD(P)-dependent dehydrogenase (short-subunit alcohol dehydrogenase family)